MPLAPEPDPVFPVILDQFVLSLEKIRLYLQLPRLDLTDISDSLGFDLTIGSGYRIEDGLSNV